jgi:hypothetical protein
VKKGSTQRPETKAKISAKLRQHYSKNNHPFKGKTWTEIYGAEEAVKKKRKMVEAKAEGRMARLRARVLQSPVLMSIAERTLEQSETIQTQLAEMQMNIACLRQMELHEKAAYIMRLFASGDSD